MDITTIFLSIATVGTVLIVGSVYAGLYLSKKSATNKYNKDA